MPTEVLTFIEHVQRETRGGPVHKFKSSSGKTYDTFDADLAARVVAQLTKPTSVTYDEIQNGKYTNYTIRSVGEHGAGGTEGSSEATVAPSTTTKPSEAYWQEKDMRITRSHGVNTAIHAIDVAIANNLLHVPEDVVDPDEWILQRAIKLAPITAVYTWAGKK